MRKKFPELLAAAIGVGVGAFGVYLIQSFLHHEYQRRAEAHEHQRLDEDRDEEAPTAPDFAQSGQPRVQELGDSTAGIQSDELPDHAVLVSSEDERLRLSRDRVHRGEGLAFMLHGRDRMRGGGSSRPHASGHSSQRASADGARLLNPVGRRRLKDAVQLWSSLPPPPWREAKFQVALAVSDGQALSIIGSEFSARAPVDSTIDFVTALNGYPIPSGEKRAAARKLVVEYEIGRMRRLRDALELIQENSGVGDHQAEVLGLLATSEGVWIARESTDDALRDIVVEHARIFEVALDEARELGLQH